MQNNWGMQNNMQNMNSMQTCQNSFGEGNMQCSYQLLALPAGVAPPEGAIPAGSMMPGALQTQAPLQTNSQWEPPHKKRFRILDPNTGEELKADVSQDGSSSTNTSWEWPLGKQE